jgi:hypothetical protein
MQTITVDIIHEKALQLLKDLEKLKLIRLRRNKTTPDVADESLSRYKGAMSKQPVDAINQQLDELRSEWE